jgi:hypothetical protein
MLGPVGRIAVLLLVLIVAALGARVLFVDARSGDETDLPAAAQPQVLPALLPEPLPEPPLAQPELKPAQKITIVDPDPDLDQNTEPADCQGTPDQPGEPKPESPAPH